MMRVSKVIYLLLMASLLAAACSKGDRLPDPVIPQPGTPSGKPEEIKPESYTYTFSLVPETKAMMGQNCVEWEEGDEICLMVGSKVRTEKVRFEDGKPVVSITSATEISSDTEICSWYPAILEIAPSQRGGRSSEMPMASEPTTVDFPSLFYHNLGAMIDFHVYSSSGRAEKVKSITFNADSPLAGDCDINPADFDPRDLSSFAAFGFSESSVTVTQDVDVAADSDHAEAVRMIVAPGNYSGEFVVVTDHDTYSYALKAGNSLARNTVRRVNLDLDMAAHPAGEGGDAGDVNPGRLRDWLELPAYQSGSDMYQITHRAMMNGAMARNYTLYYDASKYTSYWVAYPLCSAHLGSGRNDMWAFDPSLPQNLQTSVLKGYGAENFNTEYHGGNFYARGHQIPNADRNGVPDMANQTYFSTNLTPQIQNGFNGDIWTSLENGVRYYAGSADTLYVVTGAAFSKVGESKAVKTAVNSNDGIALPVPNYYYKVLLKVRRSGQTVTSASAIGFWFEHKDYGSSSNYGAYAKSVDQIEAWTGFDFFANLPEAVAASAEANTSTTAFGNF